MVYKWRKEPPDSDGVWAFSVDGVNVSGVGIYCDSAYREDGYWCRIGDVPVIEKAVKYRPVRRSDAGSIIQVHWVGKWSDRYFVGISQDGRIAFEVGGGTGYVDPEKARIVDDGKAAPIEGWLNVYPDGEHSFFSTKDIADAVSASYRRLRCVRVREVIE